MYQKVDEGVLPADSAVCIDTTVVIVQVAVTLQLPLGAVHPYLPLTQNLICGGNISKLDKVNKDPTKGKLASRQVIIKHRG